MHEIGMSIKEVENRKQNWDVEKSFTLEHKISVWCEKAVTHSVIVCSKCVPDERSICH